MKPRIPEFLDPVLMFRLSDRDFNHQTSLYGPGIVLLVGGSIAGMWFTHFLGF